METRLLFSDDSGITEAAILLRAGALVAFPTETVYGLGGDARNDLAVAAIFDAKGRPSFNPLIVHVLSLEAAREIAVVGGLAEKLASAFWPGPLTLVLPLLPEAGLSPLVTAGLASVAIRVPAHPVARAILKAAGRPIAAPSANPSGKISPTRAAHVMEGLAGRIAAIVDGGDCSVGLESTIVGLVGEPQLLRPGGMPIEAIEACLGAPLSLGGSAERPSAPGQLASHYAPNARVRLEAEARREGEGEVWIGYGPQATGADFNLSATGDLVEAAANLFRVLREADALSTARPKQSGAICISPIPEKGLGRAINDRLRRAAAPRG